MKTAVLKTMGKAVAERAIGIGPGRVRSAVVAAATGTATAVVTYRVLRSGGKEE